MNAFRSAYEARRYSSAAGMFPSESSMKPNAQPCADSAMRIPSACARAMAPVALARASSVRPRWASTNTAASSKGALSWPSCVNSSTDPVAYRSASSQFPARHSVKPRNQRTVAIPEGSSIASAAVRTPERNVRARSTSADQQSCSQRAHVGPPSSSKPGSNPSSSKASLISLSGMPRPDRKYSSPYAASARHRTASSRARDAASTASLACFRPSSAPTLQRIRIATLRWIVARSQSSPPACASASRQRRRASSMLDWASARCTRTVARSVPGAATPSAPSSNVDRSWPIPGSVVHVGCREEKPAGIVGARGRRDPKRFLGELSGRRRRAARARGRRGRLKDRGDIGVRSGRGKREMACPFLGGRDELRQPGVQRSSARLASRERATAEASSGCVKRIRSPSSSRIRSPVSRQARLRASAQHCVHENHGRLGQPRDHAGDVAGVGPQTREPRVQKHVKISRDGELLRRRQRAAPALECCRQLEREEGIAAASSPRA